MLRRQASWGLETEPGRYQIELLTVKRVERTTDRRLGWPFRATTDINDLFGNDHQHPPNNGAFLGARAARPLLEWRAASKGNLARNFGVHPRHGGVRSADRMII